jgi:hypothetical protein
MSPAGLITNELFPAPAPFTFTLIPFLTFKTDSVVMGNDFVLNPSTEFFTVALLPK